MPRYGGTRAGLAVAAVLCTLVGAAPATAGAPSAAAVNVLTHTSVGGPNVAVGHVVQASLKTGTTANFYSTATGTNGVKCTTSQFTATILTNPVAPGTATESLTGQTFGGCTSNVPGTLGVNSVVVNNLPFATKVTSGGAVTLTGTNTAPIQSTVSLRTLLGNVTCVYRATGNAIAGVAANATTSITFINQPFTKFSGPVTCFANAYFSATYAPVRDISVTGSPITYVN